MLNDVPTLNNVQQNIQRLSTRTSQTHQLVLYF